MKKTNLLALIILTAIVFTSCKKESDPEPDARDNFVATYSVSETWIANENTLSNPVYSMYVEKSVQFNNKVLLNNFANYGAGITVDASIKGDSIIIAQQTLPNLRAINGSGIMTDTMLVINYTEMYNGISTLITANLKKR